MYVHTLSPYMRKLLYIIVATIILAACVGNGKEHAALDAAQTIINDQPDSALAILDSLEPSSQNFSRSTLRRWQLLRLMAQNKCDTVFRSDSLQLVLTDYYDHHGTPNEKMMAHYLLGRSQSDMGETPEAMRCYQEAIACADTTSFYCDWWNLTRIYQQLADEYYESYMPIEMKEALRLSRICALHAKDTITSIIALAKLSEVYELMERRDSAAMVIWKAVRLFKDYGRDDLASQTLSLLIEDEVEKGNLEEASRIIRYYEECSGYFDDNHEIDNGREIYYYSKGVYYIGIGQADSAELMFRKLQRQAQDVNDIHAAHLGLRKTFLVTGPKDSLVKYAILSESSNDSLYQEHYKVNIQQLQKRFNYSRHVENEQQLKLSSERKDKIIMGVIFSFLIISVVSAAFYNNKRKKREALLKEYRMDLERLQQLQTEKAGLIQNKEVTTIKPSLKDSIHEENVEKMREHIRDLTEKLNESKRLTSEAISTKDEEIRKLTEKYKGFDKFLMNKTMDDIVKTIRKSDIVRKFEFIVAHPIQTPSTEEWDKLDQLFHEVHPNFTATLQNTYKLTVNEYRLCQLVLAGISPKGIAVLMGFNKSNVTNIRKRLLSKITGKEGKASEFDKFLFSISPI